MVVPEVIKSAMGDHITKCRGSPRASRSATYARIYTQVIYGIIRGRHIIYALLVLVHALLVLLHALLVLVHALLVLVHALLVQVKLVTYRPSVLSVGGSGDLFPFSILL